MNVGFGYTKADEDGLTAANGADLGRRCFGPLWMHWMVDTLFLAQAGVKWSLPEGTPNAAHGNSPPTTPAAVVSAGAGLISGQTYFYRIAAKQSTSVYDWTAKVSATPSAGNLRITVTWAAPTLGLAPTTYRVYRSFTGLENTWDEFKDVAALTTIDDNTGWTADTNIERKNIGQARVLKYTNGAEVLYFEWVFNHAADNKINIWSAWNAALQTGSGNLMEVRHNTEQGGAGGPTTLVNFYMWLSEERMANGLQSLVDFFGGAPGASTIAWERFTPAFLFNNAQTKWLAFGSGTTNIGGVTSTQRDVQPWDFNRRNLFLRGVNRNQLDNRVYWAWPVMASGPEFSEPQILATWAGKHWLPLRDDSLTGESGHGLTNKDTVVFVDGAITRQYHVFLPPAIVGTQFTPCLILKSET